MKKVAGNKFLDLFLPKLYEDGTNESYIFSDSYKQISKLSTRKHLKKTKTSKIIRIICFCTNNLG